MSRSGNLCANACLSVALPALVVLTLAGCPPAPPTGPTASFSVTPDVGVAPFEAAFIDTSDAGGAAITSWIWGFGDGTTGAGPNPTHTYTTPGVYAVSLRVASAAGVDTVTQDVTATEVPWFVKIGGTGDGTSWAEAFGSIQDAIDAGVAAGGGEVWVAAGAYTAASSTDGYVVEMAEGVHLYGGFAGTETYRGQRDWDTKPTTIDGESTRRGVRGADNALLDGFGVTNGYTDENGGGMYNNGASPAVANCTFSDNTAAHRGGGMYNDQSSSRISYCSFSGNHSNHGGGMYNHESPSLTVTNCTFSGNTGTRGGGMHNRRGAPLAVINCTFLSNTGTHGGGMYNHDSPSLTVTNCVFSGNTSAYGGGMYNYGGTPLATTNCIIWGNSASLEGEAIYTTASDPPTVTYSCVEGGHTGEGNIDDDPLLIGTLASNGQLRPGSPCIDTGTSADAPATDIRGVPRPAGTVDMGAHELDDSDGDGISDTWERDTFGDLRAASASSDADGDRLADGDEGLYASDPFDADTDGDGMDDGEDVTNGWDPTVASGIRRVDGARTSGTEDGLSWATAFTSIQAALDTIGEGEVWVAAGTYTAGTPSSDAVVEMKARVHLYGGFTGTETTRGARDWETNVTVIDGELTRRCVVGANHATLDGFVFRNGHTEEAGGGMYNHLLCSPTVANCTFTGNTSEGTGSRDGGGGMSNYLYSSPTVSDCTFTANAAFAGGGMYNSGHSSPALTDCTFNGNTAFAGGGMYNSGHSSPALTDCTFNGNTAERGGGMYNNFKSSPMLSNCLFDSNNAPGVGGGMYNYNFCLPTVANCTFTNNSAESGGGIYAYTKCAAVVTNCVFSGNTASTGGALASSHSEYTVTNSTFSGNAASGEGGAVYYFNWTTSPVVNCILWGNSAGSSGDEVQAYRAAPTVTNSCVEGGYAGGTDIVTDDPLFVDAAGGDYSLQGTSPCIDTGTATDAPTTDILGVARPQGSGYDMGAYEYAGK
jgi:predicted outer membrane repeat protein